MDFSLRAADERYPLAVRVARPARVAPVVGADVDLTALQGLGDAVPVDELDREHPVRVTHERVPFQPPKVGAQGVNGVLHGAAREGLEDAGTVERLALLALLVLDSRGGAFSLIEAHGERRVGDPDPVLVQPLAPPRDVVAHIRDLDAVEELADEGDSWGVLAVTVLEKSPLPVPHTSSNDASESVHRS